MKLLQFDSYEQYRDIQVAANRLKFKNVFVERHELKRIAAHFSLAVPGGLKGLCHGVRNGFEVKALRKLLPQLDLVGTDISDTVLSIPNCIVWDMHELKDDWVGAIDFVYSNSWDHTYDPSLLFQRWSACLSPRGRLYLSYTVLHSERGVTEDTKYDAFGCSLDELLGVVQPTLVLDDVLENEPRLTTSALRRAVSNVRRGRFDRLFSTPTRSRRVLTLVLRKRTASRVGSSPATLP